MSLLNKPLPTLSKWQISGRAGNKTHKPQHPWAFLMLDKLLLGHKSCLLLHIVVKTLLNDEIPTLHKPLTLSGPTEEHKVGVKLSGDPGFSIKIKGVYHYNIEEANPFFSRRNTTQAGSFHRSDQLWNIWRALAAVSFPADLTERTGPSPPSYPRAQMCCKALDHAKLFSNPEQ